MILTNPDMLHVGVLPHHDRWGDVLANLRYVVVDEAHVYRGVFGSHVANVLRRLRRLARAYDSEPQFVLASATIANAAQLAESLLGEPATVIDSDAAPRTERTIALWNPELIDAELGVRASALGDASRLLASFVERDLRTICFAKSRKAVELIHRFASDRVEPKAAARLAPYRAGYTPSQRREIEQRLMSGELLGVTATDALELGIDIGSLDCAISVGFPGTVSSLRQQWGRAGRRSPGLAVLVASEDALDQYFMREPETLLGRTVEAAILDHANPRVLDGHVLSAAFEGPIDEADAQTLGPEALERAAALPELKRTDAGWVWAGKDYPAARVLLRSGEIDSFTVVDAETGPCSAWSSAPAPTRRSTTAPSTSTSASSTSSSASTSTRAPPSSARANVDWYTQAKKETQTSIVEPLRSESRLGLELFFGRVSVTERVVAYQRKSISGGDTLETVPLDLPETSFETEAVWFSPTPAQLSELEEMPKLLSSLHAAEHSLIALLPLWAMCDRWDIGGLSTNIHYQTGLPTIFVYDGHAGGVGITERGFERFEGWVEDTAKMLAGCPCAVGCPSLRPEPEVRQPERLPRQGGALTLLRGCSTQSGQRRACESERS